MFRYRAQKDITIKQSLQGNRPVFDSIKKRIALNHGIGKGSVRNYIGSVSIRVCTFPCAIMIISKFGVS